MERQLVTLAIFSYNQERFILDALKGAFSQTYSPLEILISDDCSTDGTFAVIEEFVENYQGPHEVTLNRNPVNLGIVGHVNFVTNKAKGELIVGVAGDDISFPDRVEKVYRAHETSCVSDGYIFSNMILIDENGHEGGVFAKQPIVPEQLSALSLAQNKAYAFGCTSAWTKSLLSIFGPIPSGVVHEDMVLPFRASLAGKVTYIDEPLIYYRRHQTNVWKAANEISSIELYMKNLKVHADGNCNFVVCQINDLKKWSESHSANAREARVIMERLDQSLLYFKTELALLNTASGYRKVLLLVGAMLRGIHWKKVALWSMLFFFPSIFIKRFNRRVQRQSAN